jgi:hypothetical protein
VAGEELVLESSNKVDALGTYGYGLGYGDGLDRGDVDVGGRKIAFLPCCRRSSGKT